MSPFAQPKFDVYDFEHTVVRTRNRIRTLAAPKGDRSRTMIFIIGHARTGTTSFHQALTAAGIRSQHASGQWHLEQFEAFSDRGDYRPLDLYRRWYPNARFILNTRPMGKWLRSIIQIRKRAHSAQQVINLIHRRNRYFAQVLNDFQGADNLAIVNIEAPGAIAFAFDWLGLELAEQEVHANKGNPDKTGPIFEGLDEVMSGEFGQFMGEPFVVENLLTDPMKPHANWLKGVPNNL